MSDSLQGFGEPSNGLWAAINTADHLREMGGAKGKFFGGGGRTKVALWFPFTRLSLSLSHSLAKSFLKADFTEIHVIFFISLIYFFC